MHGGCQRLLAGANPNPNPNPNLLTLTKALSSHLRSVHGRAYVVVLSGFNQVQIQIQMY